MATFSKRISFSVLLMALGAAWTSAQTFSLDGVTYSGNAEQKTCFVQGADPALVSISIPQHVNYNSIEYQVVSINFGAFADCSALETISIPASVSSIGNNAFNGCVSLSSLTIADASQPISVGYSHDYTSGIDRGLFSECPLRTLYLGRNVTNNTHRYATFSGNDELTSLTIGDQVTEITASMFSGCSALEAVSIPESVQSIGSSAFSGCSSLKSVELPSSLRAIGPSALFNCSSLTSIALPASISAIEESLLSGCAALTKITLPEKITAIGANAFSGCAALTEITLPQSVTTLGSNAFSNCSSLKSIVIPPSVSRIEMASFSDCSALSKVELPASVNFIGALAFSGCKSLPAITIPAAVTSIGNGAFSGCSSIAKLTLSSGPETLDCGFNTSTLLPLFAEAPLEELYIGRNLSYPADAKPFTGLPSLKKLTVSADVSVLDGTIFDSCSSLTSLTIEDGNSEISTGAEGFANCPISTINLGRNVALTDARSPFNGMASLKKLTITDGATEICENLFRECPALTWVSFPANIMNVYGGAFADCASLEGLSFEDGSDPIVISAEGAFSGSPIKSIYLGRNLSAEIAPFSGLNQFKHLTIGSGVSSIAPRVFRGCPNLTKLTIEQGSDPLNIEEPVEEDVENTIKTLSIARNITGCGFRNSYNLTSVTVYDGITTIGPSLFEGCNALKTISFPASVVSIGNKAFADCSSLNSIELPSSLSAIDEAAFLGCSALASIQLPSSLTSITNASFARCSSLSAIEIPGSVTLIGQNAFSDCPALTSLTIADSSEPITIDHSAFRFDNIQPQNECPLQDIYLGREMLFSGESPFYEINNLKSVTIGNPVETLSASLFRNCPNLAKVKFGTGLKTIEDFVFHGCVSLRSVRAESMTPPSAFQTSFPDDTYRFGTLYVADEAMPLYQTTAPWDLFRQLSSEPESGIQSIKADSDAPIYDLRGIKLPSKSTSAPYIQNRRLHLK
ncbi:MAG: leucine-rich repeat domain-containing protein [Muribaculaceae bacterium]|nr:leucine-rich repeat domain-containing protein [Muribaculaceae bacterium]